VVRLNKVEEIANQKIELAKKSAAVAIEEEEGEDGEEYDQEEDGAAMEEITGNAAAVNNGPVAAGEDRTNTPSHAKHEGGGEPSSIAS